MAVMEMNGGSGWFTYVTHGVPEEGSLVAVQTGLHGQEAGHVRDGDEEHCRSSHHREKDEQEQ